MLTDLTAKAYKNRLIPGHLTSGQFFYLEKHTFAGNFLCEFLTEHVQSECHHLSLFLIGGIRGVTTVPLAPVTGLHVCTTCC